MRHRSVVAGPVFTLLPAVVSGLILSHALTKTCVRAWPETSETRSRPFGSPGADAEAHFLRVGNETTRKSPEFTVVTNARFVREVNETTRESSGFEGVANASETEGVDGKENDDTLADHTADVVYSGGDPSARDYLASATNAAEYSVTLKDCIENKATVRGTEGVVLGLKGSNYSFRLNSTKQFECKWRIVVPKGRYVILTADMLGPRGPCKSSTVLQIIPPAPEKYRLVFIDKFNMACAGRISKSPIFLTRSNVVEFNIQNTSIIQIFGFERKLIERPTALPDFRVVFTSTAEPPWSRMTPVFTSPVSGFITSPGFDVTRPYGPFLDASYNLSIPEEHVLIVSFPHFDLAIPPHFFPVDDVVKLSVVNPDGVVEEEYSHNETGYIPPYVFRSATLVIQFITGNSASWLRHNSGMNVSFSFHPLSAAPRRLDSGLFDCAVPHYHSFKQHVHCNLESECEGGEDEGGHCPFSSPACRGLVDAGEKCFLSVDSDDELPWEAARGDCRRRGGDLAMMKTPEEWEAFWKLYDYGRNRKCAYIGLTLNHTSLTRSYTKTWRWLDSTAAFDVSVTKGRISETDDKLFIPVVMVKGMLLTSLNAAQTPPCSRFVCQVESNGSRREADSFPSPSDTFSSVNTKELAIVRCPAGHFTRTFLRCYSKSMCGGLEFQTRCRLTQDEVSSSQKSGSPSSASGTASSSSSSASTPPNFASSAFGSKSSSSVTEESVGMFECDDQRAMLPYTLVCDFIHDCPDSSDEKFCEHDDCGPMFQCKNGQCLSYAQRCDRTRDCWDGSDEEACPLPRARDEYDFVYQNKVRAPSVIEFTPSGTYTRRPLSSSDDCPRGYFRCPSSVHCLPIYLRCNSVIDCPSREDELDCDDYACPGFYRCRGFSACLLVDQLCDGFAQCPWRDDELLCEATCPQTCRCQGLAFVCHQPFQADGFPQLRYLDASRSGMTPDDLAASTYLVDVSLAWCGLQNVAKMTLPNLLHLDLSRNDLEYIDMDVFLSLKQLRTLNLMGNPLTFLAGGTSDERHFRLKHVDLSQTHLSVLSSEPFKSFFSLQSLNASFGKAHAIAEEGFRSTQTLTRLDLRGNSIKRYPHDVFTSLANIRYIYTDDYKLCCPGMLPEGYEEDFCTAPQNEISSCEDLLRSGLYRAFLWFVCVASIVGNVGCFIFRNVILKSQPASGFNVFVSNLSVADCLMGVYLAFIGTADQVYRGSYYRYEDAWTSSAPCSASGFVSLLSNEVSAFTICLITLDRFIVLRFPFSALRFEQRSALFACLMAWVLGLCLASVPLLVPHWQFYSHTGICIPLPVTRQRFGGQEYSFGVIIVFNFILFLVIAVGQGFIYHSVRMNAMTINTTKKLRELTIARRLITVAVSDFLCWFPIGLLGILVSVGVPVPGEVNVAMAIFVLPLNSALNPFLYTFNVLMERRRKEEETRLLKWLETTVARPSTSSAGETSVLEVPVHVPEDEAVVTETKKEILQRLRSLLESELVSCQDVRAFLLSFRKNADWPCSSRGRVLRTQKLSSASPTR